MSLAARPFALTNSKPVGGGYKGGLVADVRAIWSLREACRTPYTLTHWDGDVFSVSPSRRTRPMVCCRRSHYRPRVGSRPAATGSACH